MWCCIKYVNSPNVLYYHSGWTEYTKRDNTKIYSVDLRTAKLGCAVLPLHLIPVYLKEFTHRWMYALGVFSKKIRI